MTGTPFKQQQKDTSKFIWKGKMIIRYKLLQDAKARGGLRLADLKLYFSFVKLQFCKDKGVDNLEK